MAAEVPGVIRITNTHYTLDPALWLKGVLSSWDSSRTDGLAPTIYLAEDAKGVVFRDEDVATVYTTSTNRRPLTITYQHRDSDYRLSVELLTSRKREHLAKMLAEAERLVNVNRVNSLGAPGDTQVSGRWWAEWVGAQDFGKTERLKHRAVADVTLHGVAEDVMTQ